jgi:hypothetical protein
MFCLKCGAQLPVDSQFCQKCGQAQSIGVSGGGAAAVAPARIPVPAPKSPLVRWTAIGGIGFLVVFCAIWQLSVNSNRGQASAPPYAQAQPKPQPQLHTQSTGDVSFIVSTGGTTDYKFTVPSNAYNATLKGHFAVQDAKDIQVLVFTEDGYVNWKNKHPAKTFYNSGAVTQDTLSLSLPSDATYHVIFSNKSAFIFDRAVKTKIDLNFYTL